VNFECMGVNWVFFDMTDVSGNGTFFPDCFDFVREIRPKNEGCEMI